MNGHFSKQILKLNLQLEEELKRIGTFEAKLNALQEDVNRNVSEVIQLTSHYGAAACILSEVHTGRATVGPSRERPYRLYAY